MVELSVTPQTFDGIEDLIVREQFVETSSKNLATFFRERDPKNAKDLADLAETYLAANPDAQLNKLNKQVKAAPAKSRPKEQLRCRERMISRNV